MAESRESDARDAPQPHFQKPLLYNRYLPYSELVDDEARTLLQDIKVNLSVALQKRELWPGALYWTNRLSSYLRVYGFRFSKEDHIKLVKLLYELLTIPNLESPLVHTWANLAGKLLKKWRLLSRDDLTLPWKPLYQLVKQVFHSKFRILGMRIYSTHAANAVQFLVTQARNYFPVESTEEMLEEWRPLMCPFDLSMVEAVNLLSEFLPTLMPPEEHDKGFKLWFDEFITLWQGTHTTTQADEFCIKLFVRLARHNIGYVDWAPYMSQLFTRILRSFQLLVGPKELQIGFSKDYLDPNKAATFVISMLGGGSQAQDHLDRIMVALESYYHPSNFGRHTRKLLIFLKELSAQFITRLKKERHSKPSWFRYSPKHVNLTKTDVDRFVKCLLPSVRMAVFGRIGILEAAISLHNLSLVRPEMVLPDLLNRTYTALETLTEPHQLTATLQCVSAVGRALLSGGDGRYPEGRSHLFSLLTLALPGIDPNDFRKTLSSGLLISSLVTLVPLVDCSPSIGHFEMTEEETELCSATSQFEDFVLQFLDRCFALVENTGLEQVTALDRVLSQVSMDSHEAIMGLGISGTVHSVLAQCSPNIFQVALDKLYRFATSHVFESEVAGRMCGDMCAAAAKVDAASTLKLFVPRCTDAINTILEDVDQRESEHPDNDLIWNIQLLSHVLHGEGTVLLSHADTVISCLEKCVHLKCRTAAQHAAKAVCNALHCLTMIYPLESRSVSLGFGLPPEKHLYIRDWAIAGNINDLALEWHTPSDVELQLADRLMEKFLQPELDRLQAFMEGEQMDRDTLHQSLQLVLLTLLGSASYLPIWCGKQVEGCPSSVVPMERGYYTFNPANTKLPPEQFRRENIAQVVHRLIVHILEKCEDDTKSMSTIAKILKMLLVNFGIDKADFEGRWRAYTQSKIVLEDKLHGKRQHIRAMTVARIHLQHELRMLERSMSILTPLHFTLIKDLFRTSVSTYTEVRIKAQNVLLPCLETYLYAGRKLLPEVLPFLRNDNGVSHEQFKGALHIILLPPVMTVFLHDWVLMREVLPMIVQADHSEKPSIVNLMEKIQKDVLTRYDHFTLQSQVPESCVAVASTVHTHLSAKDTADEKTKVEAVNKESMEVYEDIVSCLVDLVEQDKLQWRYSQMAFRFLLMLIRHDYPMPVSGVRLVVNSLVHDAVAVRKMAIGAVTFLLQQLKRKCVRVPVDIAKEAGVEKIASVVPPGERDDNSWLCYHPEQIPKTSHEWDSFTFIDKTHWGYYSWPRTLYKYASYREQPQLQPQRKPSELNEAEMVLYKAFSSPEFVKKLISFLSLEENKGKDQYNNSRFVMFKALFRNFGSVFLPQFQPHMEKLAVDTQESNQRCSCEIIGGMLSGSKHWNFEMVEEMRLFLEPLLQKVLEAVTPETVEDWGACFTDVSANRDPRRIYWLLELLMENPLHGKSGAFVDASHLYLLQSALAQQEWRVATLHHRLLDYLRPHFSHPYKNVRERIGSVLAQIFLYDTSVAQLKFNPRRKDLVAHFFTTIPEVDQLSVSDKSHESFKSSKIALDWLVSSYQHSDPELFQLLAKLLPLTSVEDDDEIGGLIKSACSQMSHAELSPSTVPIVLACLKEAIQTGLWKVRVAALQILQILVYGNFFTFAAVSSEITDVILQLMADSQIEVRELASSTFSGLLRCGYITDIEKLKASFVAYARINLPRKKADKSSDEGYEGLIVKKHSGVLGLAALVEAYPYTVPKWLPDVLDEVACHLHDPVPIQATVKKAMSEFRRTHYDSWSEHKQKFTDDQLTVLADLLVSPSYYV